MTEAANVFQAIDQHRGELKQEWSAGDKVLEMLSRTKVLLGEYGDKINTQAQEIGDRDVVISERDRQLIGMNSDLENTQGKVVVLNTELAAAYQEMEADEETIARIEAAKAEAEAAVADLKGAIAKVQADKESAESQAIATAGEFASFQERTSSEYAAIVEQINALTKESSSEQDDLKTAADSGSVFS